MRGHFLSFHWKWKLVCTCISGTHYKFLNRLQMFQKSMSKTISVYSSLQVQMYFGLNVSSLRHNNVSQPFFILDILPWLQNNFAAHLARFYKQIYDNFRNWRPPLKFFRTTRLRTIGLSDTSLLFDKKCSSTVSKVVSTDGPHYLREVTSREYPSNNKNCR